MKAIVEYIQKRHISKLSKEDILKDIYSLDSEYSIKNNWKRTISPFDTNQFDSKDLDFIRYNEAKPEDFNGLVKSENIRIPSVVELAEALEKEKTCLFSYRHFLTNIRDQGLTHYSEEAIKIDEELIKNNIKIVSTHLPVHNQIAGIYKNDIGSNNLAVFTTLDELKTILNCVKKIFKL